VSTARPAPREHDTLPRIAENTHDALVETMASVLGETPACTPANDDLPGDWIIGIMSFVGAANFSFMLALPRASACPIAERFAGFAFDFDGPDMGDVVGELVNVVSGDIVARLERAGLPVEMSLPTVARGSSLRVAALHDQPEHVRVYTTGLGKFWMRVVGQR
jgi:CheY-specific phosphatase CheX